MEVVDYLNLIPSANRNQPNFTAMISACVGIPVQVQKLMIAMMTTLFDIDVAVGDQLDIIGQWVGVSRNVAIPIDGVYFSWDGTDYTVGWEYGSWQPSTLPTSITALPDDAYRTLIRAKIAANHWDGTTNGAYDIWNAVFPQFTILIQDHYDMSYDLAIIGGIVDSLTAAIITSGLIPLKPEGVRVNEYLFSVDTNPAFAWDVESTHLKGWEEGSWLREVPPT